MGRIVVGNDGSAGAKAALLWAADEAKRRSDDLEVVTTWQPQVLLNPYPYGPVPMPSDAEIEDAARAMVEKVLSDAGIRSGEGSGVTIRVLQGAPAPTLLDAAEDADLLVIGSRGYGSFRGMLLGSVSHHCVAHATCPTVIVPTPHEA